MKILFVDDEENVLAAFRRNLRNTFELETASSGAAAIEMIEKQGPYAVIVSDMTMPGMDGVRLLSRVAELSPDSVRVMLTGNADQRTAVDAVNTGKIFKFINKPCPPEELVPVLREALKQFDVQKIERNLLEVTVAGCVRALADVLGLAAPFALGDGQRLRDCVGPFARMAGVGPVWELEVAALLANIGFASVPANVIRKIEERTPLDPMEREVVNRVPQIGHDLIAEIPRLERVAEIVRYSRKRFDGGGEPKNEVAGASIPVGARMLRILADRLALENEGLVKQKALEYMRGKEGYHDPGLLEVCFKCFPEFLSNPVSSERAVITARIRDLRPGQIIISDLSTRMGALLIRSGNTLTESTIERLKNYASLGLIVDTVLVQDPSLPERQEIVA